jgi:hypothetical protein
MTIIEALHDPRLFLPVFKDIGTWRAWEVYLKALFALPIQDEQELELFRQCTGLETPSSPARESFVIAGRRSGKSFISSVLAVFLSMFRDWSKVLSPGEIGWIFIIAVDLNQAKIIRHYMEAVIDSSPSFRKLVKNRTVDSIILRNGVNITTKASNFRSLRGFTCLACILEELAFYRSEDSANPDREIVTALKPALSTVPDSLLIGISTPYSKSGVLWEQFKSHFGKSGGPLIWRAESTKMNPTLDIDKIEAELISDPESAKAEWLAEFRTDISNFLPLDLIEACIVPERSELPCMENVRYTAFCDPSGGRSDSFTLAIAHRGAEGRVILDILLERKPPFSPEDVVKEYAEVLKSFHLSEVTGDSYSASWCSDSFRNNGIFYQPSEKSASELYLGFLPLLASGRAELLDQKRLKGQLSNLERKVRAGGRDLIKHGPGLHDDCSNAVAGACVLAVTEIVRDDLGKFWSPVKLRPSVSGQELAKRDFRDFIAGRKKSPEQIEEEALEAEIRKEDEELEREFRAENPSIGFTQRWKK